MTEHENTTRTVYSSVVGDDDRTRLERYLYEHTSIVASAQVGIYTRSILATTAYDLSRAVYLAGYQCDRLASGLYAVVNTGTSVREAVSGLEQWLATEVEFAARVAG